MEFTFYDDYLEARQDDYVFKLPYKEISINHYIDDIDYCYLISSSLAFFSYPLSFDTDKELIDKINQKIKGKE